MLRNVLRVALAGVLLFGLVSPLLAQMDHVHGFRGEVMSQITEVQKKLNQLADTMPQDKYTWRPMDGVRSVSEVFVHVGNANGIFFPHFIGVEMEGSLQDAFGKGTQNEKNMTNKKDVAAHMMKSTDSFKKHVAEMKDSDLEKMTEFFGNKMTYRAFLMLAVGHMQEHLGQSIAYARMNGVTPPWSEGTN